MGDALLRSAAQRLTQALRDRDTVSRMGGDEFVVVRNGVADAEEVRLVVEQRLIPRIRQAHAVGDTELNVSCSVGVALYPDDGQDIDALMRHADVAMYQAKAAGRDNAHVFTQKLNDRARRRLSSELLGVEALLRWSPESGPVTPTQFIPIAEETGLIVPIGAWVIGEACRQMAQWRAEGQAQVNVSALQMRNAGLLQVLRQALTRHDIPPTWLELELTESTLMDGAAKSLDRMRALRELGVRLSVDDFGTGYSEPQLPEPVPDRHAEDRPQLRAADDGRREGPRDHARHHRARPLARPARGGRRRGDGGGGAGSSRGALRRAAGLPVRMADAGP